MWHSELIFIEYSTGICVPNGNDINLMQIKTTYGKMLNVSHWKGT